MVSSTSPLTGASSSHSRSTASAFLSNPAASPTGLGIVYPSS